MQTVDFAGHARQTLREVVRIGRSAAVADAEEKMASSVESHPASEVQAALRGLVGGRIENHLEIGQAIVAQFGPRDGGK